MKSKTEKFGSFLLEKLNIDELVTLKQQRIQLKQSALKQWNMQRQQTHQLLLKNVFFPTSLTCKAPAVKREAARTIANIASLYPEN